MPPWPRSPPPPSIPAMRTPSEHGCGRLRSSRGGLLLGMVALAGPEEAPPSHPELFSTVLPASAAGCPVPAQSKQWNSSRQRWCPEPRPPTQDGPAGQLPSLVLVSPSSGSFPAAGAQQAPAVPFQVSHCSFLFLFCSFCSFLFLFVPLLFLFVPFLVLNNISQVMVGGLSSPLVSQRKPWGGSTGPALQPSIVPFCSFLFLFSPE